MHINEGLATFNVWIVGRTQYHFHCLLGCNEQLRGMLRLEGLHFGDECVDVVICGEVKFSLGKGDK